MSENHRECKASIFLYGHNAPLVPTLINVGTIFALLPGKRARWINANQLISLGFNGLLLYTLFILEMHDSHGSSLYGIDRKKDELFPPYLYSELSV